MVSICCNGSGNSFFLIRGYACQSFLEAFIACGWVTPGLGFVVGMAGWIYIIFEIFRGESSIIATKNDSIKSAFASLRLIVVVGWSIYPLGYVFGYLMGAVDAETLNLIYNLADFINKILFGLVIWKAAVDDNKQTA